MVISPEGFGTKNDCAAEDQQHLPNQQNITVDSNSEFPPLVEEEAQFQNT
jgi:hypothetical protein